MRRINVIAIARAAGRQGQDGAGRPRHPGSRRAARSGVRPATLGAAWLAAACAMAPPSSVAAQRSRPEFTRQGLLVANFAPGAGADTTLGDRVADLLRDRLDDVLNGREVDVVGTGAMRGRLQRAGFDGRGVVDVGTLEQLGRNFRVDEYVVGTVTRGPGGVRLDAQLVLARDRRLRQPLPPVTASGPEGDAVALARVVQAARVQLAPQRRCENLLRDGRSVEAARAAREGIALYPAGALARSCLVTALRVSGARATDLLAAARELLAADSLSARGLEAAGMALDSLRRRDEAAGMWLRLAATDSADLELTERVLWSLHDNGNARAAEPLAVRTSAANPDSLRLLHLTWRIANANGSWPVAIGVGESLLERDTLVARDSGFVARLVTAYQRNAQPYHALATAARGVATIPSARLYAIYAEIVRGEADTVLGRGLALYPKSADLLALNARTLRSQGRIAEALAATREAVAIDPTLPDGQLSIAQAEFDLGQPDSALATLRRVIGGGGTDGSPMVPGSAPAGDAPPRWSAMLGAASGPAAPIGDPAPATDTAAAAAAPSDSLVSMTAQFALAKGNTLLRAANATKTLDGFDLALRFLTFGDSLRPTAQGGFLRGVAALGVASAAATQAAGQRGEAACALHRTSAAQLPIARAGLEGGRELAAEAAGQYLAFLAQLQPFVDRQLAGPCAAASPPDVGRAGGAPPMR